MASPALLSHTLPNKIYALKSRSHAAATRGHEHHVFFRRILYPCGPNCCRAGTICSCETGRASRCELGAIPQRIQGPRCPSCVWTREGGYGGGDRSDMSRRAATAGCLEPDQISRTLETPCGISRHVYEARQREWDFSRAMPPTCGDD